MSAAPANRCRPVRPVPTAAESLAARRAKITRAHERVAAGIDHRVTAACAYQGSEHKFQRSLVALCRLNAALAPPLGLLFAIPNAGKRGKAVAGRMKAEGLLAGVPDLFLPVAGADGSHGLFLELKTAGTAPTDAQWQMLLALHHQGYRTAIVNDLHTAGRVIINHLAGTFPQLTQDCFP